MSSYLHSHEERVGPIGRQVLTAKSRREGIEVIVSLFDIEGRGVKRPGWEARSIARDYLSPGQTLVKLEDRVPVSANEVRYTYLLASGK